MTVGAGAVAIAVGGHLLAPKAQSAGAEAEPMGPMTAVSLDSCMAAWPNGTGTG